MSPKKRNKKRLTSLEAWWHSRAHKVIDDVNKQVELYMYYTYASIHDEVWDKKDHLIKFNRLKVSTKRYRWRTHRDARFSMFILALNKAKKKVGESNEILDSLRYTF